MSSAQETASRYQLVKKGSFDFELAQVPKTTPGEGEVLVKIKAIALNPLDWKQVLFGIYIDKLPAVIGCEAAGIADSIGTGVTRVKPGDEVFGRFAPGNERSGVYQEYAITSEKWMIRKPSSISYEEAASLPIGFTTALGVMHVGLDIRVDSLVPDTKSTGLSPKTILVLGGSSAVGAAAIQILRKLNPSSTILATSSAQHHLRVKQFGATAAFSQQSDSLVLDIRAATPNSGGVDVIIDAANGLASQPELFETLDPHGPKRVAEVPTGANLKNVPEGVTNKLAGAMEMEAAEGGLNSFDVLGQLVEKGQWQLPSKVEVAGHGLESLYGALMKLKSGVSGTKLVVKL